MRERNVTFSKSWHWIYCTTPFISHSLHFSCKGYIMSIKIIMKHLKRAIAIICMGTMQTEEMF